MNRSIRNLSLAGVAAFSAAGILGATLVQAQDSSGSTGTSTSTAVSQQQAAPAAEKAAYLESLATNLGVSSDALKAAVQKTNLDTIAKLEADGTITAAVATQLRQRVAGDAAAGRYPFGVGGRGGDMGGRGLRGADSAALATFLGVSADQLRTELSTASLAAVAQTHGKTRDQLKAFLTQEAQTHVAQEVAAGRHTQAEADAELARMVAALDTRIDAIGGAPHGGRGPGGPGQPAN